MPAILKCPKCGFEGNHGFNITNGGTMFYHGHNSNSCIFWVGHSGKVYDTHLDLFKGEVIPNTPKDKASQVWIKARIADLSGHPRIAKRLYDEWHKLGNIR